MNIQEYISSGILEAYVLGELPESEVREVEELARKHKEVREEILEIESSLEKMAFETAIQPNEAVKKNIFTAIESNDTKIISIRTVNYIKFVAAASIIIAIVSSFLAYNYYDRWKSAQVELNELIAQNERIAQDYHKVNQRLDQVTHSFNIVNDDSYENIRLEGTENAPNALARVYWNFSTKDVYLSAGNLKELADEKQYQLWAIVDGKPVDAGVFDATHEGLLKMKNIAGAAAFAITIEPKGGSVRPSLETLQVTGGVNKG